MYDWATYLGQYFKKMPNITKFHHFRFSRKELGVVYCKARIFEPEIKVSVLRKTNVLPQSSDLPPHIKPNGLDKDRKNIYLMK